MLFLPEHEAPELPPWKVLVVDDEPVIRSSLAECLEAEGFETAVAATGVQRQPDWNAKPFSDGAGFLDVAAGSHGTCATCTARIFEECATIEGPKPG